MNKFYQPLLPYFENLEINKQYKERLAHKWFFGYYLKRKSDKNKDKLIQQYNILAQNSKQYE